MVPIYARTKGGIIHNCIRYNVKCEATELNTGLISVPTHNSFLFYHTKYFESICLSSYNYIARVIPIDDFPPE